MTTIKYQLIVAGLLLLAFAGKAPAAALGTIQGTKSYPSEYIPADYRVCAINLSNKKQTCVTGSQPIYRLQVPAGHYHVYAVVPSFDPKHHAFYNRFVTCGMTVKCKDHTPITVNVSIGKTVSNIDVGDFYPER